MLIYAYLRCFKRLRLMKVTGITDTDQYIFWYERGIFKNDKSSLSGEDDDLVATMEIDVKDFEDKISRLRGFSRLVDEIKTCLEFEGGCIYHKKSILHSVVRSGTHGHGYEQPWSTLLCIISSPILIQICFKIPGLTGPITLVISRMVGNRIPRILTQKEFGDVWYG